MAQPLIGITSFADRARQPAPYISLKESYVLAIEAAGGVPVILPVADAVQACAIIPRSTGFFFPAAAISRPGTSDRNHYLDLAAMTHTATSGKSSSAMLHGMQSYRCSASAEAASL
jgi:Predicted glutamine amidotransferases